MFQERYMSTRERLAGDEDEFFKYYKQYRPSPLYSSSVASSEELFVSTDNVSSSNSSSSVSQFRSTLQNLLHLPGKTLNRRMNRRPIRSRSEETGVSSSSRLVLQKQPLSLDRCFLPDLQEDSPLQPRHKRTYEETMSRDSGHSSGGSPDIRSSLRRARLVRRKFNVEDDQNWSSHLQSWEVEPSLTRKLPTQVPTTTTKSTATTIPATPTKSKDKKKKTKKTRHGNHFLCCIFIALLVFGVMYINVIMSCHHNRLQGFDYPILRQDLKDNLFGQHIAQQEILSAVSQLNGGKVSVLIFMGSSGTGKSHATNILCHQFPIPGNVHQFSVPLHFSSSSPAALSTLDDLSHNIPRSCGYSMVIFDDIDGIEVRNSEYIASFIASLEINHLSRRRSNGTIVVISSRAGGDLIDELALNHARSGFDREEISFPDLNAHLTFPISNIVELLLKRGIMVSVVPFLPLTRQHVRDCIARELSLQSVRMNPLSGDINDFLEEMPFFAKDFPIFSSVGCKRVAQKVSIHKEDDFQSVVPPF